MDTEARTRVVVGRCGVGDGRGDDDDDVTHRSDRGPPPLHRLRQHLHRYPQHRPRRNRLLARHRHHQFRGHPDRARPRQHDLPVHRLRQHLEFHRRGRRRRHLDHRVLIRRVTHLCVEIHRDVVGGREIPNGCRERVRANLRELQLRQGGVDGGRKCAQLVLRGDVGGRQIPIRGSDKRRDLLQQHLRRRDVDGGNLADGVDVDGYRRVVGGRKIPNRGGERPREYSCEFKLWCRDVGVQGSCAQLVGRRRLVYGAIPDRHPQRRFYLH